MAEEREAEDVHGDSEDGRVRRGARNREAILDAMYALVQESHLPPSIEEVAKRAGVGTRTVFRQFDDFDSLYRSMGERVVRELVALVVRRPPIGRLEDDLSELVGRRARIFEHMTPFRRASRLVRHQSSYLQEQDAKMTQLFRGALLDVVGPHLGGAADDTVEALDVLLSFEAWERLRHPQKMSVKRAERILTSAAVVLVRAARRDASRRGR